MPTRRPPPKKDMKLLKIKTKQKNRTEKEEVAFSETAVYYPPALRA